MKHKYIPIYIRVVIVIWLSTTLFSCKRDTIMFYEGETGVYFPNTNTYLVSFAFSVSDVKDSILKIPVRIFGNLAEENRKFDVVAERVTNHAAGDIFAISDTFSIKAGKTSDTVKIKLFRTPEMLVNSDTINVRLIENENFKLNIKTKLNNNRDTTARYTRVSVVVNDMINKPNYWRDIYLGPYSRTKLYLMAEICNVTVKEIIDANTLATYNPYSDNIWGRVVQLYLNDQKSAGTPVYDEDGSLMRMGNDVQ